MPTPGNSQSHDTELRRGQPLPVRTVLRPARFGRRGGLNLSAQHSVADKTLWTGGRTIEGCCASTSTSSSGSTRPSIGRAVKTVPDSGMCTDVLQIGCIRQQVLQRTRKQWMIVDETDFVHDHRALPAETDQVPLPSDFLWPTIAIACYRRYGTGKGERSFSPSATPPPYPLSIRRQIPARLRRWWARTCRPSSRHNRCTCSIFASLPSSNRKAAQALRNP